MGYYVNKIYTLFIQKWIKTRPPKKTSNPSKQKLNFEPTQTTQTLQKCINICITSYTTHTLFSRRKLAFNHDLQKKSKQQKRLPFQSHFLKILYQLNMTIRVYIVGRSCYKSGQFFLMFLIIKKVEILQGIESLTYGPDHLLSLQKNN